MVRPITPPGPISILEPKKILSDEARQLNIDTLERYARNGLSHSRHVAYLALRIIESDAAKHDQRVTGLIRYNSEQVIQRREINAHRIKLLEWVGKARDQFRYYAQQHREKIPKLMGLIETYDPMTAPAAVADLEFQATNALKKSQINEQLADEVDAVMIWQPEPGSMGKP